MNLKNTYYVLRHGQTNHHVKYDDFTYFKWMAVSPEIHLTEKGKKQIKESVKQLKGKIDLVYSSDFFRTRQSAKIASGVTGAKIQFDKRLRDINLGIYHGVLKADFKKKYPLTLKNRFSKRPKSGESWSDLKKRMKSVLDSLEKKYKGKKILVVSHGDPLWMFEGLVRGLTEKQMIKEIIRKRYIKVGELRKIN